MPHASMSFLPKALRIPRGHRNGYENEGYGSIKRRDSSPTVLVKQNDSFEGEEESAKRSTGEKILDLAVPALGSLLIDPLLTLADTAFVGRFSESPNELAGMGSAAALLTFSFYLFNFLCTATTPLVASKRSAGFEKEALAVGGQALSLALGLGSILTVGLLLFSQPLLQLMGTGSTGVDANTYATDFLTVRAFAAPAVFCISASTGVLRGYLDTKTPIVILVLANLVNLALDIILIAYLHMGPTGAAIATTTAEWISALLFLGVLAGKLPSADGQFGSSRGSDLVSVVPSLSIPPWNDVKPLVVASSSIFFRSLILQLSLSTAAALAARGGETLPGGAAASIAAHQIAVQLWILCSFTADALAAASQGLVADALGREDQDDVLDISKTVFVYSGFLGLLLAATLQLLYSTSFLVEFFTSDAGTQLELTRILALVVISQPLNSIVFAADGVLQGAAEFAFQAKSMALSGATAAITFYALQAAGGTTEDTLPHIWLALIALQFMRGLTSFVKLVDSNGPIRLFRAASS
jgi:putative MATE family efflux protein